MKYKTLLILLFVFLVFLFPVQSFKMMSGHTEVDWEPGLRKNFTITILSDNEEFEYYLDYYTSRGEELSENPEELFFFHTPKAIVGKNKRQDFIVELRLPEDKPSPGSHRVMVAVDRKSLEDQPEVSGITAKINLAYPVIINVPYDGKYLEAHLQPIDGETARGDDLEFHIKAKSISTEIIDEARAVIDIFEDGQLKQSISQVIKEIPPGSSVNFRPVLNTSKLEVGEYSAEGKVFYDGLVAEAGRINLFRIGSLEIKINNISENVIKQGLINRIDLEIESLWNKKIDDVYLEVSIKNESEVLLKFRTDSKDLGPREISEFPIYIDALDLENGIHIMETKLIYGERETIKSFQILVSSEIESPAGYTSSSLHLSIIVVLLIVIIILTNLIFYLYLKRMNKKKSAHNNRKKRLKK